MFKKSILTLVVATSMFSWQVAEATPTSTLKANVTAKSGKFQIKGDSKLEAGYYIKNFLNALEMAPGSNLTVKGKVHNYRTIKKETDIGSNPTIKLADDGSITNYKSYTKAISANEDGTFNKETTETGTGWEAPGDLPKGYDPDDSKCYLNDNGGGIYSLNSDYKKSAYYDLHQDEFYNIEDSIYHDKKSWPPAGDKAHLREYQNINAAKIEGIDVHNASGLPIAPEDIPTEEEGFDRFLYTRSQIEDGGAEANEIAHRAYFVPAGTKVDIDTGDVGWEENSYGTEQTSKHSYASFYSIEGYDGVTSEYIDDEGNTQTLVDSAGNTIYAKTVDGVDESVVINKTGGEDLIVHGDQSWYNGVVNVKAGKLDIYAEGAMFGGKVVLQRDSGISNWKTSIETGETGSTPEPSITWRGGSKDPDNKPTIVLGHGTHMNFNLDEGTARGDGDYVNDPVFSFYGSITNEDSADTGRDASAIDWSDSYISFKKGTIYIKGDCSGFKGILKVAPGSKFVVRDDIGTHGQHKGVMFQGQLEVTDPNSAEKVTLDLTDALHPITQKNGTMLITNTNTGDENTTVQDLTTGSEATTEINVPQDASLKNTKVEGTLKIVSGQNVNFDTLDIDGGVLEITGAKLGTVNIKGEFSVGSGLNTMGNNVLDTINSDTIMKVKDGRNLEWKLDLDPINGKADCIVAPSTSFTTGSSLIITDYKLISTPVEDSYTFQILKLTDSGATYIPISIGTTKTVTGGAGTYSLYAEGGDGYITLRVPNATVIINPTDITPSTDTTAASEKVNEINNVYLPTQLMHSSMFSAIGEIFNTVMSETTTAQDYQDDLMLAKEGVKSQSEHAAPGRFRFWNKTFAGTTDFKTDGTAVSNNNHGTIFGFDAKPHQLQNGTLFVPTVFAAYSGANDQHNTKRARSNNYMFGAKASWYGSNAIFDLIASYDFAKTHRTIDSSTKDSLKSHIFSVGAKAGYAFKLPNNFSIIPNISGIYSFVHNTDSKLTSTTVKNKNLHLVDIAPGIDLSYTKGVWKATVGAKYNIQNSHNVKGKIDGTALKSSTTLKKNFFECDLSVSRQADNGANLGFGIAKSFGNKKGTKFKINFSAKF